MGPLLEVSWGSELQELGLEKADRRQPGRQEKNKADKNTQTLDRHRQCSHKHTARIQSSDLSASSAQFRFAQALFGFHPYYSVNNVWQA